MSDNSIEKPKRGRPKKESKTDQNPTQRNTEKDISRSKTSAKKQNKDQQDNVVFRAIQKESDNNIFETEDSYVFDINTLPQEDMPDSDENIDTNLKRDIVELSNFDTNSFEELRELAGSYNIDHTGFDRQQLKMAILENINENSTSFIAKGVLEIVKDTNNGNTNVWGFLRHGNLSHSPSDIYISHSQIRRFNLKTGDIVTGQVRAPRDNEKYYSLLRVEEVNALNPESNKSRKPFEELIPIYPNQKYYLEVGDEYVSGTGTIEEAISLRIIDLFAPIGKGQRGLIVAPPKAGKTTLLKDIANAFVSKYPETFMIILLVDERPEEVTDIKRSVVNKKYPERVKVVASTFDEPPETHMQVSDMVLEMSKRLVESGHDVVVLLDSITRMARSSNLTVNPSGRTLSGGLDPSALYRPKRFIGAARNIENGGSLTVIATALVDTGSKMDDSIFEEFKATGNMELVLDRSLAEKRIYPAIDIRKSGTRHDEKLFSEEEFKHILNLQRALNDTKLPHESEFIIRLMKKTKSNGEFILTAPLALQRLKEQRESRNGKQN